MTESSKKKNAGRPEKPVEQRLIHKVTVAFTQQEFADLKWTAENQPARGSKPSPKTDKATAHYIRTLVLPEVETFVRTHRPVLPGDESDVL
ncbi:MAG: hypothetical protein EOO39_00110 [Cytophagaceae bacterium]|jgi:hypothetical protein|nr:MAG: hypothetical protein EOO39_00110 [Cytophagaceae bacterium]